MSISEDLKNDIDGSIYDEALEQFNPFEINDLMLALKHLVVCNVEPKILWDLIDEETKRLECRACDLDPTAVVFQYLKAQALDDLEIPSWLFADKYGNSFCDVIPAEGNTPTSLKLYKNGLRYLAKLTEDYPCRFRVEDQTEPAQWFFNEIGYPDGLITFDGWD